MGGNDELNGGIGDDVLNGGAGVNLLRGGLGNDTFGVTLRGSQVQIIEDFVQGDDLIEASFLSGYVQSSKDMGLDPWARMGPCVTK